MSSWSGPTDIRAWLPLTVSILPRQPRIMDLGLLARALKDHQIDLAAGNATDGLIPALDLFVLADDRHYFPPYEAVPVVRKQTIDQHPEVAAALNALADKISDTEMQQIELRS